jgi:hypothetical protein
MAGDPCRLSFPRRDPCSNSETVTGALEQSEKKWQVSRTTDDLDVRQGDEAIDGAGIRMLVVSSLNSPVTQVPRWAIPAGARTSSQT